MSEGRESAEGGEPAARNRPRRGADRPVMLTGEPLDPAGEQQRASRSEMEPLFRGTGDRRPAA